MKRTLSRVITAVLVLAMVISMMPVSASALTWDNVSETRYASRYVTSDYTTGKFYKNMTQIPLTGDGRRDVVAVAASQVGYIEGDNANGYDGEVGGSTNYTEYGYFLGMSGGSGHAWCAAFCAWTFYVAEVTNVNGASYDTNSGNIWADTYVPDWSDYLISLGRYKAAYQFRNSYPELYDASYVPQPGDLVFFYTASEDYPGWEGHIGLVAYSDGTYVYTLEGNTSSQDGVESEGGGAFFKKYSLTGSSLVGFGVMPYETVDGLPTIDYTGANPTPGLYVTTSGAKSVYQNIDDSTASWTLPMSSVFEVLDIGYDSDGIQMLYSKCEIDGETVYGWIVHGSDTNGYTKTLQIYASAEIEIPESYGPSVNEQGEYVFENAYGYTFRIDDLNGSIGGEDATLITSASAYESCNPNWAISVQLRPNGNDGEYSVVKVVAMPGSAANADITLADGDVILVVHSADSKPGQYANWMSKVAAMALKEGDVLSINSTNTSATVLGSGEPIDPPETEPTEPAPEPTEPEVTEPAPEPTEPEVTEPAVDIPNYGGAIAGAGQQGYTGNLYYGCDVSFYNVGDQSYANYETLDDSGADYSLLDFEAMKASGCDFVIIRLGSEDSTGKYIDPHFAVLYEMAREADMDIGLYYYSYAMTYDEAAEDAEFVLDYLSQNNFYFEYPIYIDIEEADQLALSTDELSAIGYGWCETMKEAGYFPGIYTGYYASETMSTQLKSDYDMWIAAYMTNVTPDDDNLSAECSIWQYSSTMPEVFDGIGLDFLDVNVCYKDYPAIIKAGGYNTGSKVEDPNDKDGDGIPDSYGVTVENGIYAFENAYGFVFDIDDVNGTIGGEDATLITSNSAYSSCGPNWAISVVLDPTGEEGEYQVTKVVVTPGSAANAGITLEDGQKVLVVHSAASYPSSQYTNWMSKVAAVALKEGDIIEISSDNKTATVIGPGEQPEDPEVTDPTEPTEPETEPTEPETEPTEPETEPTEPETEPTEPETEPTEPEETKPDYVLPGVQMPEYGGAIAGAGIPGSANNVAMGCDVSFYNVNDQSYANYETLDDSGADYSLLDFERMKADGCDFVILRLGSSDSSGYYYDPHFVTLYNMARAAGMDIGLYFYSYAMNESEAIEEAEFVIDVIEDHGMYFEYPIYIDIEESDQLALGQTTLDSICYGWCETMYDAGYFPGIYGNYNLYDAVGTQIKNDYDFWIAWVSSATSQSAYNPSTHNLSNECGMWQYSFYGYEYDGVGLDMLDVNVAYKDYPSIMSAGGYNNIPKSEGLTIPGSYGPTVGEDGRFAFDNAYGYVFNIDDLNGQIEGEDTTLVDSSAAFNSCNPNWAICLQLRPTEDGKYEVVDTAAMPGSAAGAGFTLEDGDKVLVVHSAESMPGQYDNWMSKVAALAVKEGDIIEISSDNKTATVLKPTHEHTFVAGAYTWTEDYDVCSVTGTCACGETADANTTDITYEVTTTGTCKTAEVVTYTAVFTESWAQDQTKTVTGEKDMENHESDEFTYTDNEDGATHTKAYECCGTEADAAEAHTYENGECVCGAEEPVEAITVIEKGDVDYEVEGNVVTVTHTAPCKVGYWDEANNKYVVIQAQANEDGTYSFTAPEGVTEVLVVVKGDVNGDGKVNIADRTALARSLLGQTNANYTALTEAWQKFAADINGDGNVNIADRTSQARSLLGQTNTNYAPLTW